MERLLVYIMSKMFTLQEMEEMENIITSFLEQNKVVLNPPVDIFKFATSLGFDVRAAKFPKEIEGLIIVDETSNKIGNFQSCKVIGYNIGVSLLKNKFVVAHELANHPWE